MSNVKEKVEQLAKPIVESLGYELAEVEYAKKFGEYNLTLFIYNENGITLDDCEKVSKALDGPLDELDPTEGVFYMFNVSSLGLDRAMKTDRDFERNLNKEIEVKFFKKADGKKSIEGILSGYDKDSITVKIGDEEIKIERKDIAKASLVIHF